MVYGVTQYGNHFFELIKIKGCPKETMFPFLVFPQTEITEQEWKKLYYSGAKFSRHRLEGETYSVEKLAIEGNWKEKLENAE